MSAVAQLHLQQIHQILKMDTSPERFQWMRRIGEDGFRARVRRAEWLRSVGLLEMHASVDWDRLPKSVRAVLCGARS